MPRVRVAIADDHRAVREALKALLESDPEIELVGVAEDGEAALALARESRPDVLVLDQSMPGLSGLDVTRIVAKEAPRVAVILYSGDSTIRLAAMANGAAAFVQKGARREELLAEVRRVSGRAPAARTTSPRASRPDLVSWSLDPRSQRSRTIVAVLILAAYAVVFVALDASLGASVGTLSVVPVLLGAGLLGVRGGVAFAAATLVITGFLWAGLGHQVGDVVLRIGGGLGVVALLLIGLGMGRMRDLRQRAEARTREVEALSTAAQVVAAGALAGDVLPAILDAAVSVVPTAHAMLLAPTEGGTALEVLAGAGGAAGWRGHRRASSAGIIGRCYRTGKAQIVAEARTDSDYLPWVESARSLLCVPIIAHTRVLGVLALLDDIPVRFTRQEADLLRAFAAHAAVALENERLIREDRARSGHAQQTSSL